MRCCCEFYWQFISRGKRDVLCVARCRLDMLRDPVKLGDEMAGGSSASQKDLRER
jgi:hypothetical protein